MVKKRLVSGGLLAAAVMLSSGAAFSDEGDGGATTLPPAPISKFVLGVATQQVFEGTRAFLHVAIAGTNLPLTEHLMSVRPSGGHPPDPCRLYAGLWDQAVNNENTFGFKQPFTFVGYLGLMAAAKCQVQITFTGSGSTLPIMSMAPVLQ